MRPTGKTVWSGHAFAWKRLHGWTGQVEAWLRPRLRLGGIEALQPGVERNLYWDDEAWIDLLDTVVSDLDSLFDDLAESLGRATLRTCYGTRTDDAGTFSEKASRSTIARG